MEDKELYQHILGLNTPWSVGEVKLDMELQQIDIHVEHPAGTKFCCPNAINHFRVTTMLLSVSGDIWTVVNSRPFFMLVFLG